MAKPIQLRFEGILACTREADGETKFHRRSTSCGLSSLSASGRAQPNRNYQNSPQNRQSLPVLPMRILALLARKEGTLQSALEVIWCDRSSACDLVSLRCRARCCFSAHWGFVRNGTHVVLQRRTREHLLTLVEGQALLERRRRLRGGRSKSFLLQLDGLVELADAGGVCRLRI